MMIDEVVTLQVIKLCFLANVAETHYVVIVWFFLLNDFICLPLLRHFLLSTFCNCHVLYNSCLSILILHHENVIVIGLLQQLQRQSWTI